MGSISRHSASRGCVPPAHARRRVRSAVAAFLIFATAPGAPARASGADPCREAIASVEPGSGLPPGLLEAIALVESGRPDPRGGVSPWPWASNAAGTGRFHATRAEAVGAVAALRAQGVRSVDVGCMQVNLHHHPAAFASLEDAFDPLANVRYAAGFLAELHRRAGGDWARAIGWYHSTTPNRAAAYRARVLAGFESPPGASPPAGGVVVHRPQAFALPAPSAAWWAPASLPAPALAARLPTPALVVPRPAAVESGRMSPEARLAVPFQPAPARAASREAAPAARLPSVITPGQAGSLPWTGRGLAP